MSARIAKSIAGLALFAACGCSAPENPLEIESHPQRWTAPSLSDAFTILPCGAFRKNADGGWTLVGTLIVDDGNTFTDQKVPPDDPSRALDDRCELR